jgi:hypothetical protein
MNTKVRPEGSEGNGATTSNGVVRTSGTSPAHHSGLRRRIATMALAVAAALTSVGFLASPASAAVSNCSSGYVNATMAWGTCRSGSGSWSLTVQCYYWGANTAYGNGPGSIYATCPGWSHITSIILRVQY